MASRDETTLHYQDTNHVLRNSPLPAQSGKAQLESKKMKLLVKVVGVHFHKKQASVKIVNSESKLSFKLYFEQNTLRNCTISQTPMLKMLLLILMPKQKFRM